jgi:hypothetical protein
LRDSWSNEIGSLHSNATLLEGKTLSVSATPDLHTPWNKDWSIGVQTTAHHLEAVIKIIASTMA